MNPVTTLVSIPCRCEKQRVVVQFSLPGFSKTSRQRSCPHCGQRSLERETPLRIATAMTLKRRPKLTKMIFIVRDSMRGRLRLLPEIRIKYVSDGEAF
jgi:hypothetical protein